MKHFRTAALTTFLAIAPMPALAQVTVGVITAATGPGASLGIPYKNTFAALPATLGGQPVNYIVLDDATDPATATRLARKLVTEDKVDLIIGSGNVPTASAISYVASETKTPQIALSPLSGEPAKNPWVYSVSLPTTLQLGAIADDIVARGAKKVGYIGFSDGWGDQVYGALMEHAPKSGYEVITNERYARLDTSVTSQALKVIAAKPDVVVLGGSGTPGALPHTTLVERGYKGQIYHTAAVVNPDFLRIGGKAVEGALVSAGPVVVVEQLPDGNPVKKAGLDFTKAYEAKYGQGSRNSFSAYSWDAYLIADRAIAAASQKAKPGTPEFRQELRDALEDTKEFAGAQGVYTMNPSNHAGSDKRAVVVLRIKEGAWILNK
ncbi:ABC transporter substrate-binding protein [Bradyrhizobium liaoningense]|uniref:ABC transporter substrate-binding protein n=1 Tax=Bradyrhizobium liaoningense TaxID=43992 RepID=UPI001BAC45BF|nr:ABC transporter substrate-binding protein [Bradyrhizobium liaoningense]MBR0706962.1 ABC transporter substrate-binding protein [Bradyrhizobium liaoningense]